MSGDDTQMQYYVYVLEASLAFAGGLTIPLMSEFASYTEGDTDSKRQDCEQKAFKRLAKRLKDVFSRLPIMVLLDGLYPLRGVGSTSRRPMDPSWNCATRSVGTS